MAKIPQHPAYLAALDDWKFLRLCAQGGKPYLDAFLHQHLYELPEKFRRRKKLAFHPLVLDSVLSTYASHLYGEKPARELTTELAPLETDADAMGGALNDFLRKVAYRADLYGSQAVLVDRLEPEDGTIPMTRAQELEAGRRPFFQLIDQRDLFNWSVDKRGRLEWAAIWESADMGRHFLDKYENAKTRRFRVWTRAGWFLYEYDEGAEEGSEPTLVEAGSHPVGEVPISVLYMGERLDRLPLAERHRYELAKMNARITNLYSMLDEQIYHYVFSILVVDEAVYDSLSKANWSVQGAIGVPSNAAFQPFYLSPDIEQIRTIQEQIDQTRDTIRVLSGLGRANERAADTPSGEALRVLTMDKTKLLKDRAGCMERFEQDLYRLALKWGADPGTDFEPIPVQYSRVFFDEGIDATLEQSLGFQSLGIGGEAAIENAILTIKAYFRDRVAPDRLDAIVGDAQTRLNNAVNSTAPTQAGSLRPVDEAV